MRSILVLGATGDVGQGICTELIAGGYRVIAAARSEPALNALTERLGNSENLETVSGDVSSEASARTLRSRIAGATQELDAVIASINAPRPAPQAILEADSDQFGRHVAANLKLHLNSAKAFIPALGRDGLYLAIGGGMADFIVPGLGLGSVIQAAQRNLVRSIARERRGEPTRIQELMLYSMIAGASNRDTADPSCLTAADCGRHVRAILEQPSEFPGTILALRSREQVGRPETPAQTKT